MSKAVRGTTTRRRAAAAPAATTALLPVPPLPPDPPKTESELAHDRSILDSLEEMIRAVTFRNLDSAVALAVLARQGKLPDELQKHFCELGRRYAGLLVRADTSPTATKTGTRPAFGVIEGGAA